MGTVERGRWLKIEGLYHQARDREGSERAQFLAQACAGDEALRQEVESLLAHTESTGLLADDAVWAAADARAATRTRLKTGEILGPYQVLGLLGAGGMGEVYSAVDTRLDRKVAIKFAQERFSGRFEREARAISALNHPNICTLYDVGPNYLVTELVEGEDLCGWLEHSPSFKQRLVVFRQVLQALRVTHEAGIVHRDLKPGNIMVRFDGFVKVLDFGLAKWLPDKGAFIDPSKNDATAPGQVMGTVAYMSPEQILGQAAEARSDLFSAGIILYELLTGRHPWNRGRSNVDTMHAILHDEPLPMDAHTAFEAIIRKCLAKQPAFRFASVAELEAALQIAEKEKEGDTRAKLLSIAVLPFANLTADKENEYFGNGLAEEITNLLARTPGIRVVARASASFFKGKDAEVSEVGRRLNVEHILEGSVRKSANRVRITVQLIRLSDSSHLWSERYDREMTDIFAIQDEISSSVVEALRLKLWPGTPRPRRYANVRAYEAYLKARDLWFSSVASNSLPAMRELIERAIELDPQFALAQSFLGMFYTLRANLCLAPARQVIPAAIAAELEALRIDPFLPEAHALLACCIGEYEHDWGKADRHWRLALNQEPQSRDVVFWYGNHFLLPTGRASEAVDAMERGLEGDPLNLLYRHHYARGLRIAGRLADAETQLRNILEIDREFPPALGTLGSLCAQQDRYDEALTLSEKAHALMPHSPVLTGQLAALLRRVGEGSRAQDLIQKFESGAPDHAPIGLAVFHAMSGELREAAEWAERSIELGDLPVVHNLGVYLRGTSWWPNLAKRMNLPG